MKKIALTMTLSALALCAGAQDMYDALRYSENNYQGSARTMAMGNAFTALGGDLGAVGINPASSAVSNYSQFVITPGVSIVTSTSTGSDPESYFGDTGKATMARFNMPNVGVNINFSTGRTTGIKNFSFGFTTNVTNSYLDDTFASGKHYGTSYAGYLANEATGNYTATMLDREDAYDIYPNEIVLGWNSGLFNYIDGDEGLFSGVTEQFVKDKSGNYDIFVGGPLKQTFGRQITGKKYDYVFNFAVNVSDQLYVGANLGISSFNYYYSDFFSEEAVDPEDFPIDYGEAGSTYFNYLRHNYKYDANGSGVYGKIGLIWKPVNFLRIGAAVQTPTLLTVNEYWRSSAKVEMTQSGFDSSDTTPDWTYRYRLRSPARFNFGIAAIFGKFGLLSVDYEGCQYGSMLFKEYRTQGDGFSDVNQNIKTFMKWQNYLRVGVEIKPVEEFAIRGGFNIMDNPERCYNLNGNLVSAGGNKTSWSFGFGYSCRGSFFIDAAAKVLNYASEYVTPYYYYIDGAEAPEIHVKKHLWTASVTFGWRF